jgi:hypothetical protein
MLLLKYAWFIGILIHDHHHQKRVEGCQLSTATTIDLVGEELNPAILLTMAIELDAFARQAVSTNC